MKKIISGLKKKFGKSVQDDVQPMAEFVAGDKIQIAYLVPENPLDPVSKLPMRLTLSEQGELIAFNYIFSGDAFDQTAFEQVKKNSSIGSSMSSVDRLRPVYEQEHDGDMSVFVPINDRHFKEWGITNADVEKAWSRFCAEHMNDDFEFTP